MMSVHLSDLIAFDLASILYRELQLNLTILLNFVRD